ncbi:alpha/beta fold hydrolase [uncultured Pontibacter sp.]|uniref:alpha/beta fold hydrolase n=1 Tax=uncultured Pontibacter sp. TaxID=453356 RepID=UPI0026258886|nr:alpha/beta fold hydrolase [uncultured Pontibacter sp.]
MKTSNWLDTLLYPFKHHTLPLVQGGNMHYVDEGAGDPIVFVHGTPTWSFVWRQQIKSLSRNYRCIAPDHLGFGLSDKPTEHAFAYTPAAHAQNLEELLNHLQLQNILLVVHDFGGPIGLRYAERYPEKIKKIVILNSWMWPLEDEANMMKASKFLSGAVGRFLYLQLGFSAKVLLRKGYHERKHLTKEVHQHYTKPLASAAKRLGTWHFAKALHASNDYFSALWQHRENLKSIPKLILWGEKDALLPLHFLDKWTQEFPDAKVVRVKAGHFLQEEKGSDVSEEIKKFI